MVFLIYNLLLPVIFVVMVPYFLLRMWRRGGYAKGFAQRLGFYDASLKERIAQRSRVWVHAVSVGETFVALRFMETWRQRDPDVAFVLSVNTSTARVLAEKSLHERDALVYFPVDFPVVMWRVLGLIRPRMLVLTEGEFWPNLIRQAKGRGVPVILINGRMSARSFRGYRRYRALFTPVLRRLDRLCVQGPRDSERYLAMGLDPQRVLQMGSAKYDVALKDPGSAGTAGDILNAAGMSGTDRIVLGGSTWPGEEEFLLDYFAGAKTRHPGLKLVLVPRHAERRDEVVAAIERRGLCFAQRSRPDRLPAGTVPEVLLVDTTGELKHLYTVAEVIFVGKSLTQHGGQNIIEPAVCGKPIVVGPNMENFADIVEEFKGANGLVQAAGPAELSGALDRLLENPVLQREYGSRAAAWVAKNRGCLQATVAEAVAVLG